MTRMIYFSAHELVDIALLGGDLGAQAQAELDRRGTIHRCG